MRGPVPARLPALRARSRPRAASIAARVLVAAGVSAGLSVAAGAQDAARPAPGPDSGLERSHPAARARRGLPDGYLGITFMCSVKQQDGPEGLTIYHYGYPAVASVAPGSPAQRAGIVPGDTIVAYDSEDVLYRKIVLSRLLRPGKQVAVRVRRNGWIKELSVRIAPRPATFVDMDVMGDHPPDAGTMIGTATPTRPTTSTTSTTSTALALGGAPMIAAGGMADPADDDGSGAPIPGLQVVRTSQDLRDALGVPGGLLVITVTDRTPAASAGIRAGDVIVSAAGERLDEPAQLTAIAQHTESGGKTLELRVLRHHVARTVVIR